MECHYTTSGELYTLQRRPRRLLGLAGHRRDLCEVKDDAQDDHHARRHAPPCTSYSVRPLHPRDSREDDDFHVPLLMYTAPLVTIKGGGGFPLKGMTFWTLATTVTHARDHRYTLSTTEHSRSSSRDLGASLPLSPRLYLLLQALRVQDNTVPSHTPCRTYGPVAGTRINLCITVLPLASTLGTRKHAAFISWDPDPRVRTPTRMLFGFLFYMLL